MTATFPETRVMIFVPAAEKKLANPLSIRSLGSPDVVYLALSLPLAGKRHHGCKLWPVSNYQTLSSQLLC